MVLCVWKLCFTDTLRKFSFLSYVSFPGHKVKYLPNKCPLYQKYQIKQTYSTLSVVPKQDYENDLSFFWRFVRESFYETLDRPTEEQLEGDGGRSSQKRGSPEGHSTKASPGQRPCPHTNTTPAPSPVALHLEGQG